MVIDFERRRIEAFADVRSSVEQNPDPFARVNLMFTSFAVFTITVVEQRRSAG